MRVEFIDEYFIADSKMLKNAKRLLRGKSAVVREMAKKLNVPVVTLRMSSALLTIHEGLHVLSRGNR